MPDPVAQKDVSEVKGSAAYSSDYKKIGSVSTVLMDPKSKKVDRLVVSEGGVLGDAEPSGRLGVGTTERSRSATRDDRGESLRRLPPRLWPIW
jgi:sporulation protein YlmC with PRC-barrel domain